ncbi:unnamed protein product [Urochloa humidicola]
MLVQGYGSNSNATDSDGATPLFSAIQCEGSQAVVEYRISSNNDPKETNNHGATPLYSAAGQEYLLSKGANVCPICQDGEAPLQVATRHGHARMVELLLKHNTIVIISFSPALLSVFSSKLCFQVQYISMITEQ